LQMNVVRMMKATTGNQIKGIFGLSTENNNIGEIAWPIYQSVPAYSTSFPTIFGTRNVHCIVPMAIDQDPYFRLARDFVTTGQGRGLLKPAAIHSEFLVGLGGISDKMSTSVVNANLTTIFLTDKEKDIEDKIKRNAFSGGRATKAEHQRLGGRLEVDVPYQYLLYLLEDDNELQQIAIEYGSGRMMSSEIKKKMSDVVVSFVKEHQRRRADITPELLDMYFSCNREFDHRRTPRELLPLLADETYERMGVGFDRYFGQAKPAELEAESEARDGSTTVPEPAKPLEPAVPKAAEEGTAVG